MDVNEMLRRALEEIKSLRHQNHEMDLRLSMFDDIMSALHGKPGTNRQSGGMHPDVAYEIEKYLATSPPRPPEAATKS